MATQDLSRYLNQPAKHYATVQMQQGRVILDSDWNERAMAEAEDLRATLLDITCSHGTPNDGYSIKADPGVIDGVLDLPAPTADVNTYDFTLMPGSFYVGGMRVTLESEVNFLTQPEWLQINSNSSNVPPRVLGTETDRYDLVYLRIWEQTVTATEDSEIREVALGGRDTSVRVRRMQRVEAAAIPGTPVDSKQAFEDLIESLEVGAEFNYATGELVSTALLTVTPSEEGVAEDPCATPVLGTGYVGAHNQAIRIQLRGGGKAVWGYDNGAPLYRVSVDDENFDTLTFLTEPPDLASMPRAGQVVEVLQWSARLDNGEKVAERVGMLSRVKTTYDPVSKQLVLDDPVADDWVTWLTENILEGETPFLFLRMWDQGSRNLGLGNDPQFDYSAGVTDVGDTGLAIQILPEDSGRIGDYWIIAARPSTPEQVTPWELLSGAPPHGPREFLAPLALIHFDVDELLDTVTPRVTDCRLRMRPLCEGGCCKVSVGDDKESFGQVSSLQDAIDLLAATGGKICVLPGEHVGTALVDGLEGGNDIIIEGCGPRSRLKTVAPDTPIVDVTDKFEEFYTPVLHIRDAARVQVRDLRIEGHSSIGVVIEQTEGNTCEKILLDGLQVFATGNVNVPASILELAAPAIAVQGASLVDIVDCEISVDNVTSLSSAVVLGGDKLRLHRSRVTAPEYDGVELRAVGGVQIRSASQDVEIVGCEISGGWGHGISLGHAELFDRGDTLARSRAHVQRKRAGDESHYNPKAKWDCIEFEFEGTVKSSSIAKVWLPTGPVEQIRIHDNVIRRMGLSGISTSMFFSSVYDWWTNNPEPVFIVAIDIDIARNLIEENVQIKHIPEGFSLNFDNCVGGICLAASICATIRENRILRNGEGLVRVPVCGIGLVAAQAATIEDNRVVGNGAKLPPPGPSSTYAETSVVRGLRGGIAIWEVTPLLGYTFRAEVATGPDMPDPQTDLSTRTAESALVIRGNKVSQPLGKALWVRRGFGQISVTGNSFESFGDPVDGIGLPGVGLRWKHPTVGDTYVRPVRGACVEIVDLGLALDVDWGSIEETLPTPEWTNVIEPVGTVTGGNVNFTNNSTRLEWEVLGGHACSVVVSSLGSVLYNSNVSSVETGNVYGTGIPFLYGDDEPIKSLHEQVLSGYQAMSFVLASTYVGAVSSAQATGNRFEEGLTDALFSLVLGPALSPSEDSITNLVNGVMAVGNLGSHSCALGRNTIATPDLLPQADANNIAIFHDEDLDTNDHYNVNNVNVGGVRLVTIIRVVETGS
jgi:hypothetical protein